MSVSGCAINLGMKEGAGERVRAEKTSHSEAALLSLAAPCLAEKPLSIFPVKAMNTQ